MNEHNRKMEMQKQAMAAQGYGTGIRQSSSDEGDVPKGSGSFGSNPHSKGSSYNDRHDPNNNGTGPPSDGHIPRDRTGTPPGGQGGGGGGGPPPGDDGGDASPEDNPFSYSMSREIVVKPLMKPDVKSYPFLKVMQEFSKWYSDSLALARAQGVNCLFDHTYRPLSPYEIATFYYQQTFFMAVLRRVIKPPELWQFVTHYSKRSDAQGALVAITNHVRKSTHAIITLRDSMQSIVNARMVKDWKGTALDFIIAFDTMMDEYNKCQERIELQINPFQKRQYLQNAVAGVRGLQDVLDRESDRITMGGRAFDYDQYLSTLKSVATRLDDKRKKEGVRIANWHDIGDDVPIEPEINVNLAEVAKMEYAINELRRKKSPSDYAAQMNRETWKSLSPDTQKSWDTFSKEEKASILTYSKDRDERRSTKAQLADSTPRIDANVHDASKTEEDGDKGSQGDSDNGEVKVNTVMWKVNNVTTTARSEAHPGDPRRMMGSSQGARGSIEAKLHQHLRQLEESDDEDSSDDDEPTDFQ